MNQACRFYAAHLSLNYLCGNQAALFPNFLALPVLAILVCLCFFSSGTSRTSSMWSKPFSRSSSFSMPFFLFLVLLVFLILFLLLFRFLRRACSLGRCCGPFGDVNIGAPTPSFFMKFRDITRAQTRKIIMKTPKTILVWALLLSDVSRRYVNVAAVIRAPTTALKPEIMAICVRILLSDRLDFFLSVESFLCWTSLSSDFSSRICAAAGTFSGPAHRRYITSTSLLRRQRSPV